MQHNIFFYISLKLNRSHDTTFIPVVHADPDVYDGYAVLFMKGVIDLFIDPLVGFYKTAYVTSTHGDVIQIAKFVTLFL